MLLYAQLAILVVLAILNITFGIEKGLYESIWWWDIVTHLLGGVWVGLFAVWFLEKRKKRFTPFHAAVAAFSVGIVWEIFEYGFGLGGSSFFPYWVDTLKDQLMDTLGGFLAASVAYLEKDLWRRK